VAPNSSPTPQGLSFRERLERLRTKVQADSAVLPGPPVPADPTGVPPPVVNDHNAKQTWDSF
jgi:hypothetical protein